MKKKEKGIWKGKRNEKKKDGHKINIQGHSQWGAGGRQCPKTLKFGKKGKNKWKMGKGKKKEKKGRIISGRKR